MSSGWARGAGTGFCITATDYRRIRLWRQGLARVLGNPLPQQGSATLPVFSRGDRRQKRGRGTSYADPSIQRWKDADSRIRMALGLNASDLLQELFPFSEGEARLW